MIVGDRDDDHLIGEPGHVNAVTPVGAAETDADKRCACLHQSGERAVIVGALVGDAVVVDVRSALDDVGEADIARTLRIAEGTVKAHLAQARIRLRAALSDDPARKG